MPAKDQILVVGSIAYDHVMRYDGHFRDVILPENFNIALTASHRNVSYGGCGGNIAYSLKLLGRNSIIMTVAGKDFDQYKTWLDSLGINTSGIYKSEKEHTAAAFIVTDSDSNQITIFDAGAMNAVAASQSIKNLDYGKIAWAVIAPDKPERMINAASECEELGIPFVFDPAQQINHIKNLDLLRAISNCDVLILNEYESELLSHKLQMPQTQLSTMVPTYIETHGAKGCSIISRKEGSFYVRSIQPSKPVDPTGCGDAFRAGVLAGLAQNLPIQKACRAGALLATYNLEKSGTQTHTFTVEEFKKRYEDNFGEAY